MSYEYMTGMGRVGRPLEDSQNLDVSSVMNMLAPSLQDIISGGAVGAVGAVTEEFKQCAAAGNRTGHDYAIPAGCIPSGAWSATGRERPQHGYCCPGQPAQPGPSLTSMFSSIVPSFTPRPSCEQQTCPPLQTKERHDFSYVGAGAHRTTHGRRAAFQARGCTKLPPCGSREIGGGGTEYYCCPQGGAGVFPEPVSPQPQPGPITPAHVPTPVPALGPEARSFLERIPPWQLIVGTGLIVGGIVWFVKERV